MSISQVKRVFFAALIPLCLLPSNYLLAQASYTAQIRGTVHVESETFIRKRKENDTALLDHAQHALERLQSVFQMFQHLVGDYEILATVRHAFERMRIGHQIDVYDIVPGQFGEVIIL